MSIVIPCRNGEAWLADAIESCLGQTWRNLQIIVVDNDSTDCSLELARCYQSQAVEILECPRKGASAARNAGQAHARGDLIQFLDADDVLDREKIRLQVERLASAPPETVASGAWARFQQATSEAMFSPEPVWSDLAPEAFLIRSWLGGGMMPNFSWLAPRTLIERAGPWNESLSLNDDGEFFSRVALEASGIIFCPDARGYYRVAPRVSMSRRRDAEALASAFAAIDLSCGYLLRRCASQPARKAAATQYQRFVYDTYPQAPHLVAQAERRIAELGGSELRPGGGQMFQLLARFFGWKFAKSCQLAWNGLRRPAAASLQ